MPTSTRRTAANSTQTAAPPKAIVDAIAAALDASALPGEEVGFDRTASAAAANFIAVTGAQRASGEAAIGLEAMATEGLGHRMRLAIVNDDMPFLVDSIAMAVDAVGLSVDRILHPVVAVRRDAQGQLESVLPRGVEGERGESLVYMEIERADARTRRALLGSIEAALSDVRHAVADWHAMQARLKADADRIGDGEGGALLRWFLDRHLTQLGHELRQRDGTIGDPLGISANAGERLLGATGLAAAFAWFDEGGRAPLLIKANRLATIHRRVLIDLVIVPVHANGRVDALSIHAGLWTSAALSAPPERVPVLRTMLTAMMEKCGFDPAGHAGKALAHVLTQLPHDLIVAVDRAQVEALTLTAMSIADRPRPKVELLRSPLDRHLFAFVWLPRDEISTNLRSAIERLLVAHSGARILGWSLVLDDGGAALLRYTLDIRAGRLPDGAVLDAELAAMVRGWEPGIEEALLALGEDSRSAILAHRFAAQFPLGYRLANPPEEAAQDILRLRDLTDDQPIAVRLTRPDDKAATGLHLKIYSSSGAVALSSAVPVLENFGFSVIEEVPTPLTGDGGHIHDFLVAPANGEPLPALDDAQQRVIEQAMAEVLSGTAENDPFNQLIVASQVAPQAANWLRAWFRYLRQCGASYGLATFVGALRNAVPVTAGLIELFTALHHPGKGKAQEAEAQAARLRIADGLTAVSAIDEDRILRLMQAVIEATLRTNAFAPAAAEALAFKIDSAAVPGLPRPLPWREIFVYSARVEGIHLRAGPVARGGLRWSDRRDDFRTEILGLMKAQRVKNAVIVPTGAKGGFYPKQLPDPAADRDAWLAEGTECYRIFIRSLLSVTDNLVDGKLVHPAPVVIRDGDDPYFVVAADKGTATFSDIANAIALDRDFWLGDAFASGGSNGYDHKAMGITAKGAWISVQRHFREMGVDVQSDPVRVAGVGDMSGDVFGNGMLLSKSIKLVAAFDHRHIFIDPDPDPTKSWAERARMFALPRSSWADYDATLISKGGGIYPRTQKSITLSAEARAALGLAEETVDPASLLTAILKAPVDLLWFGGIGTYIKAASQNNAEVGDPANDRIRIDTEQLQARVIGEGANLGVTQAGRIAFATRGGRINTDFIDNSAGVDCSDNEVNIKIALNAEVRAGALTEKARNSLLARMTDEVADLVLEDNRLQALALSIAERAGADGLPALIRLIEQFEGDGRLDRAVEGLARNDDLLRRQQEGRGLTRPELAVILSTAKLAIQAACEAGGLGRDPLMDAELLRAFPAPMVAKHRAAILGHQLRNEIVATKVANRMVNRMGLIQPFELAEEEGVGMNDVAEAFVVAERLFDLDSLWQAIDDADMSEPARIELYGQVAVELRAHMADLLRHAIADRSLADCLADLQPGVRQLDSATGKLIAEEIGRQAAAFRQRLTAAGAPDAIADPIVHLAKLDGAVGIVSLAQRQKSDPVAVTRAFVALGQATGLDWAQGAAMQMSPTDPWERLLVAGLARDFQQMRLDTIARIAKGDPEAAVAAWLERHAARTAQFRTFVDRARTVPVPSAAMLAQLAGQARTLLAR